MSAAWHSGTARRLQTLPGGFDSRLKPIAFDICTKWLLTRTAQAHFAVTRTAQAHFTVTRTAQAHFAVTRTAQAHFAVTRTAQAHFAVTRTAQAHCAVRSDEFLIQYSLKIIRTRFSQPQKQKLILLF